MTRFERRQMFERLCQLRDRYLDLADDDRVGESSVEDVIVWASALLGEPGPAAED
jgi:hypothetical protein